jgi:putative transposase
MAAARHVALNPVRAKLVKRAEDWRWSSVRAHLSQRDDGVVATAPILERCGGDFAAPIADGPAPALIAALRGGETIGRPLGSPTFLDRVAALTGRNPRPAKRGPKRGGSLGVE